MISKSEPISSFAENLCSSLIVDAVSIRERHFIVTPFRYPDGDFVSIYLTSRANKRKLSDFGATFEKFDLDGIDAHTEWRQSLIETVCALTGVNYDGREFSKEIKDEDPNEALVALCDAISRISNIQYEQSVKTHSELPEQIYSVLNDRVRESRSITRNWHEPNLDPHKAFPVDFHVNGDGTPANLFHVSSSQKSMTVAAVVNFFRYNNLRARTMAIVDKDKALGERPTERLQMSADEIRFGVEGNEESIAAFALGGPLMRQ